MSTMTTRLYDLCLGFYRKFIKRFGWIHALAYALVDRFLRLISWFTGFATRSSDPLSWRLALMSGSHEAGTRTLFPRIIHPGMTVTDRMLTLLETQADAEGISVDQAKQNNIEGAGIRRLGQPEDVAELVAFLCSPKARHIQGVGIGLDGGATSGFH